MAAALQSPFCRPASPSAGQCSRRTGGGADVMCTTLAKTPAVGLSSMVPLVNSSRKEKRVFLFSIGPRAAQQPGPLPYEETGGPASCTVLVADGCREPQPRHPSAWHSSVRRRGSRPFPNCSWTAKLSSSMFKVSRAGRRGCRQSRRTGLHRCNAAAYLPGAIAALKVQPSQTWAIPPGT